jgi:MFS-type transporter involved in bile tolerance (Atg22 family)
LTLGALLAFAFDILDSCIFLLASLFFFEASTVGETPTASKILLYKEKNIQANYRIFTKRNRLRQVFNP